MGPEGYSLLFLLGGTTRRRDGRSSGCATCGGGRTAALSSSVSVSVSAASAAVLLVVHPPLPLPHILLQDRSNHDPPTKKKKELPSKRHNGNVDYDESGSWCGTRRTEQRRRRFGSPSSLGTSFVVRPSPPSCTRGALPSFFIRRMLIRRMMFKLIRRGEGGRIGRSSMSTDP